MARRVFGGHLGRTFSLSVRHLRQQATFGNSYGYFPHVCSFKDFFCFFNTFHMFPEVCEEFCSPKRQILKLRRNAVSGRCVIPGKISACVYFCSRDTEFIQTKECFFRTWLQIGLDLVSLLVTGLVSALDSELHLSSGSQLGAGFG